ncbi:tumor necrosis factor receptor superfamily member 16-like [Mustelus asterias]
MGLVRLILLFAAVSLYNAEEFCESNQYTHDGKCCSECHPGEGVKTLCGAEDTQCQQCLDSVSYSDVISHTEPCKPCTMCLGTRTIEIPCMDNFDTFCICMNGYYEDPDDVGGECLLCDLCDEGHGVLEQCTSKQNTICEICPANTYSDQKSSVDPCLPCTVCEDNEVLTLECTPFKDARCDSLDNPRFTRVNTAGPPKTVTTAGIMTTTAVPSSPQFIGQDNNNSIIPVYCSILAAVVVGLVAYVAFKRWNSCKQNKQGANNRTVNQTPSPEGEKLHNDSGISVDNQSLQEQQKLQQQQQQQQQQNQAAQAEPSLYTALPPHKQEEVEQLLNRCEEDAEWCSLAGLLGYNEEHIDTFKQEEHPVRALLSDWAAKDSATTDALCTALRKLKRDDIIETLSSEPTATSAV